MITVSSTSILPQLDALLMEEMQLHAKLVATNTAADGLLNEIQGGALSISNDLPDATKLQKMRDEWIPSVRSRLSRILDNVRTCFEKDYSLVPKRDRLLSNFSILYMKDLQSLALYNPSLAKSLFFIDEIARIQMKKLRTFSTKNGKLLNQILEKKEAFSGAAELDKWQFSIISCRGAFPSLFKWHSSGVRIGTFIEEIERELPKELLPWAPISLSPVMPTIAFPFKIEKSFREIAKELHQSFSDLFFSLEKKSCDHLMDSIDTISSIIDRSRGFITRPMNNTLRTLIRQQLEKAKELITSPDFQEALERILEVEAIYRKTLEPFTLQNPLNPETKERLFFLDVALEDQLKESYTEWEATQAMLQTNYSYLLNILTRHNHTNLSVVEEILSRI
jgi:hypothetical protein